MTDVDRPQRGPQTRANDKAEQKCDMSAKIVYHQSVGDTSTVREETITAAVPWSRSPRMLLAGRPKVARTAPHGNRHRHVTTVRQHPGPNREQN